MIKRCSFVIIVQCHNPLQSTLRYVQGSQDVYVKCYLGNTNTDNKQNFVQRGFAHLFREGLHISQFGVLLLFLFFCQNIHLVNVSFITIMKYVLQSYSVANILLIMLFLFLQKNHISSKTTPKWLC